MRACEKMNGKIRNVRAAVIAAEENAPPAPASSHLLSREIAEALQWRIINRELVLTRPVAPMRSAGRGAASRGQRESTLRASDG